MPTKVARCYCIPISWKICSNYRAKPNCSLAPIQTFAIRRPLRENLQERRPKTIRCCQVYSQYRKIDGKLLLSWPFQQTMPRNKAPFRSVSPTIVARFYYISVKLVELRLTLYVWAIKKIKTL